MINTWLFYWISVVDSIKTVIFIASLLMFIVLLVTFFYFVDECKLNEPHAIKTFIKEAIIIFSLVLLLIFVPSKRTCMEMLIANEATEERIEMVVEEVENLMRVKDE